jgi:hypothetical protein
LIRTGHGIQAYVLFLCIYGFYPLDECDVRHTFTCLKQAPTE